jgi:hypothetical protein
MPAKINHGDPLFSAATEHWNEKTARPAGSDENFNQQGGGTIQQDPIFMDLMIHCPKSALPLHSYYSEFRLGQGDPLMKAAMKRWPFTTIPEEEEHPFRPPLTRALVVPPCHVLSALLSPTSIRQDILHMDDVGHIEQGSSGERRAVLMSDDRRFVLVE